MPELPEVETVRRGLTPVLESRVLVRADAFRPDLRFPLPPDFAARLRGRRVVRLDRRAKYMLVRLDDGWVWIVHLGMSGRMQIGPLHNRPPEKHDHVIVETDAGLRVTYTDPRRFGMMDLVAEADLASYPPLAALGPEPLDDGFTAASLSAALEGRNSPIKTVLLDQTTVAGLGNIYVCEALFRSGIAPERKAASVTEAETGRLVPAIKQVLLDAIAAGGSSLRDHKQPSGELGYFQHGFQVYGREGEPCPVCATPIARLVQAGRSTFHCVKCQS